MANTLQAKRRARQASTRRKRNMSHKTRFRTFQKRTVASIAAKNAEEAKANFATFVKVADSVAGKGIVHRNKAARIKSRLSRAVRQLSVK